MDIDRHAIDRQEDRQVWADIALVLAFVLLGGFFSAAELALVSLRPGQVSKLAASGRRGEEVAHLLENPNRFLSAVQVGVTLAGMFSSAVGAVALSAPLSEALTGLGLSSGMAGTLALVLVTVVVAYVSLVLGELAPKRLAMQRAEGIALLAAGPLDRVARATRPLIWLLGRSTDLVVRLAGGHPGANREEVTEDEIRDLVATTSELTADERRLISDVLDAGDRPVREVMIPRLDVSALPVELTTSEAVALTADRPFSRYPVVEGGLDDVVGFVHLRDLLTSPPGTRLRALARPVMRVPDTRRALPALAEMRRVGAHLAVVVDEYGGSAGIVTLEDLLEEIVGDITDEFDPNRAAAHPVPVAPALPLPDVPAQLRLDEFAERTGVRLPAGPYDTAAGWLVHELGRIPRAGDHAVHEGDETDARRVRLTVTRMRKRRVEGVRVEELPPEPPEVPAGEATGSEMPAGGTPGSEATGSEATDGGSPVTASPVGSG